MFNSIVFSPFPQPAPRTPLSFIPPPPPWMLSYITPPPLDGKLVYCRKNSQNSGSLQFWRCNVRVPCLGQKPNNDQCALLNQ